MSGAAPTKATADQRIMERDLIAVDAERLGGGLERHGLALGAAPHFGGMARRRDRRRHSAAPSGRDKRNHRDIPPRRSKRPWCISARTSPSLNQSVALAFGSRAVAAKLTRPSRYEAPRLAILVQLTDASTVAGRKAVHGVGNNPNAIGKLRALRRPDRHDPGSSNFSGAAPSTGPRPPRRRACPAPARRSRIARCR